MISDKDLQTERRISGLEKDVAHHGIELMDLGRKIDALVAQVNQIRIAMWVIAGAATSNIPVISKLLEQVRLLF